MGSEKIDNALGCLIEMPDLSSDIKSKLTNLKSEILHFVKEEKEKTKLVDIDGLTGLNNHNYFQQALTRELLRSMRFGEAVSLIIVDIDHFKNINDTYGHPQGDIVIKKIARILLGEAREYDVIARYGGEEFGLILPRTKRKGAVNLIERVRKKIAGQRFKLDRQNDTMDARVTISAGIAVYPQNAQTKSSLISRADKALYLAKEEGRNRTCFSLATQKELVRFAFCPPSLSPFFAEVLRGVRDVAEEVDNVELLVFDSGPDSDYEKQRSLIEDAINKNIDAIGICSKTNLGDLIRRANQSGIKVFVFNYRRLAMSSAGKITSTIGYKQQDAGAMVGRYLARMLRHKGKVAILEGICGEMDAVERKNGFLSVITDHPSIEVAASVSADWKRVTATEQATRILRDHPDLDAIFGMSDEMALGAVDAIRQTGKLGKIFVIGLDGNQDALRSIKQGELFATLSTNPFEMGRTLIRTVIRSTIKEEIIAEYTESPIVMVDAGNVDRYFS